MSPCSPPASQVSSQTSSVSSCDDYIIVLPDCFDTSRPLGESMYSSAMSQPDTVAVAAAAAAAVTSANLDQEIEDNSNSEPGSAAPLRERQERPEVVAAEESSVNAWLPPVPPIHSSVNHMLCASQTLDAVTLTPEVVPLPTLPEPLLSPPALYSPRLEMLKTTFFKYVNGGILNITDIFVQGRDSAIQPQVSQDSLKKLQSLCLYHSVSTIFNCITVYINNNINNVGCILISVFNSFHFHFSLSATALDGLIVHCILYVSGLRHCTWLRTPVLQPVNHMSHTSRGST